MSQVRCHHCHAHLATITARLFALDAAPRILTRIIADHQPHCTVCAACGKPWAATTDVPHHVLAAARHNHRRYCGRGDTP